MFVTGVRLRNCYQICYVETENSTVKIGCNYIIETEHGIDIGRICKCPCHIKDNDIEKNGRLIRESTHDDNMILPDIQNIEGKAFHLCKEKARQRQLDMKLISVKCLFDKTKIIFYFVSENRVDFRELVKDLAAVCKTRIEMRQIGVRDEARLIGGFGPCGREFCCVHLQEGFAPVSIKMAKEQNINLNSQKISGMCGRLLCCLGYEYDVYKELNQDIPPQGTRVMLGDKFYVIEFIDTLKRHVGIRYENSFIEISIDDIVYKGNKYHINPDVIQSDSNIQDGVDS
ncbi:MAG: regulatory iron-sulfur-containing complex subunit RicT [Spirochaetota bacterium]|nr:regulatory iron-sulfur-containing complex subunit RicT [Spirochaetota bacterium]